MTFYAHGYERKKRMQVDKKVLVGVFVRLKTAEHALQGAVERSNAIGPGYGDEIEDILGRVKDLIDDMLGTERDLERS